MSPTPNNSIHCQIYFGFGGSGAKTLVQLAQMFADDQEWAHRSESEAYFLLADTDEDDLKKYARDIRQRLGRVGAKAYVDTLLLSDGVDDTPSRISGVMTKIGSDPAGRERVGKYWWFNAKNEPFIARNVQLSPKEGASQCPAISYFFAWEKICGSDSRLVRLVSNLAGEMSSRVAQHHGTGDFDISLYTVAGLAGGTGRGSWSTLSFKICQLFKERGKQVRPIGIFFDQSCYHDIGRGTQGQQEKMIINSLTGVSEITAWLQNDFEGTGRERFMFRLPSFHRAADPDSDVVDAQRLISNNGSLAGATPIRQAWLVFREGPMTTLAPAEQYKLAAAALYGRTAKSQIASEESNSRRYMGSVGASIYRVDVHAIREYLRHMLEHHAASEFTAKADDKEVARTVEAILLPLLCTPDDDTASGVTGSSLRSAPQLGARVHKMLLSRMSSRLRTFLGDEQDKGSINSFDKEERDREIQRFASLTSLRKELETELAKILLECIKHVHQEGPLNPTLDLKQEQFGSKLMAAYFREAMLRPFADPKKADETLATHYKSIPAARAVLTKLTDALVTIPAAMRGEKIDAAKIASEIATVKQAADKKSGKALVVLGDRFSYQERRELEEDLKSLIRKAGREELASILEQWIDSLRGRLLKWQENLEEAALRAERHAKSLSSKLDEYREDELFTVDADFTKYATGDRNISFQPVERCVQPLLYDNKTKRTDEWSRQLRAQKDRRFVEKVGEIRSLALTKAYGLADDPTIGEEQRKQLRIQLGAMWDSLNESIVIPESFLQNNFRLVPVVESLVWEWARRMDAARSRPDHLRNLGREFERQFGFRMPIKDEQHMPPNREEIVELMSLRMGQTCRAQYLCSQTGSTGVPHTHVFLPTDGKLATNTRTAEELVKKLEGKAKALGSKIQFHCDPELSEENALVGDQRGNPFMMVAIATESFRPDQEAGGGAVTEMDSIDLSAVTSLNYWQDASNPIVRQYLDWIEDPHGKSMFANVSFSFGLGYIMPAFVTDSVLRSSRWRPWALSKERTDNAQAERDGHRIHNALIYALLEPNAERLKTLRVKDLSGTEHSWALPLLRFGPEGSARNAFTFTRKAFADIGNGWAPDSSAFKAGLTLTSLKKLMEHLEANPSIVDAIMAEAQHYFGVVCTEEGVGRQDIRSLFVGVNRKLRDEIQPELERLSNYADYEATLQTLIDRSQALISLDRPMLAELYED